jgi:hypothetical protein
LGGLDEEQAVAVRQRARAPRGTRDDAVVEGGGDAVEGFQPEAFHELGKRGGRPDFARFVVDEDGHSFAGALCAARGGWQGAFGPRRGARDFFLSIRLKTPISINLRFSEDSESNP